MTYHSYIFFGVDRMFKDLSIKKQQQYTKEFIKIVISSENVVLYPYSTFGLKKDTIFLLWMQSNSLDMIQSLLSNVLHTKLGLYLTITHTLFGIARPTQYAPGSVDHLDTLRKGKQFLVIYPFTKTKEWHLLPLEKRKELMHGHIKVGKNYPEITQLLLYSYGVDDQEFIVSYETNDLLLFQRLVMDLRTDPVRAYTKADTPIFTCVTKTIEEIMKFI